MQPQSPNTGINSPHPEHRPLQAAPASALPGPELPPVQVANPQAPMPEGRAVSQPPVTEKQSESTDHWVAELERISTQPGQSPHQRADAIASLKRHYQKSVLGIQLPSEGM